MNPIHEHDCDDCIYLKTEDDRDWYVCPNAPSLIIRYSSEGPAYFGYSLDMLFESFRKHAGVTQNS